MPLVDEENFWVVTSEKYVDIVKAQLPFIPDQHILAEPEPRNTAPCIAYACRKIAKHHPDANVVVTPADALVLEKDVFRETISKALEAVNETEKIVTIGITPTRPETGYGYISASSKEQYALVKVNEFKEKPNLETAKKYLAAGNYFWNAGIFVWNVKTVNDAIRKFVPGIADIMDRLEPDFYTADEAIALKYLFPQCEKISIDYAVMEKSENIYTIAGEYGWSDLGSWGSVGDHMPVYGAEPSSAEVADALVSDGLTPGVFNDGPTAGQVAGPESAGNHVVGDDVRLFNCKDCIVHAQDAKTVVVEGLEGYVVAEKGGNFLVCRLSEEQHIKEFSAKKE